MTRATTTGRRAKGQVHTCPFAVLVDTREQQPYTFRGLRTNASDGDRPIVVPTERGAIETGDYSIVGHSHQIVIERKSKADLYASVARRDNFEGRLARMDAIVASGGRALVMVEPGLRHLLNHPPRHSKLNPKSLNRTIIAWRLRYRADWWFVGGRQYAEAFTFRILERFYEDRIKEPT